GSLGRSVGALMGSLPADASPWTRAYSRRVVCSAAARGREQPDLADHRRPATPRRETPACRPHGAPSGSESRKKRWMNISSPTDHHPPQRYGGRARSTTRRPSPTLRTTALRHWTHTQIDRRPFYPSSLSDSEFSFMLVLGCTIAGECVTNVSRHNHGNLKSA